MGTAADTTPPSVRALPFAPLGFSGVQRDHTPNTNAANTPTYAPAASDRAGAGVSSADSFLGAGVLPAQPSRGLTLGSWAVVDTPTSSVGGGASACLSPSSSFGGGGSVDSFFSIPPPTATSLGSVCGGAQNAQNARNNGMGPSSTDTTGTPCTVAAAFGGSGGGGVGGAFSGGVGVAGDNAEFWSLVAAQLSATPPSAANNNTNNTNNPNFSNINNGCGGSSHSASAMATPQHHHQQAQGPPACVAPSVISQVAHNGNVVTFIVTTPLTAAGGSGGAAYGTPGIGAQAGVDVVGSGMCGDGGGVFNPAYVATHTPSVAASSGVNVAPVQPAVHPFHILGAGNSGAAAAAAAAFGFARGQVGYEGHSTPHSHPHLHALLYEAHNNNGGVSGGASAIVGQQVQAGSNAAAAMMADTPPGSNSGLQLQQMQHIFASLGLEMDPDVFFGRGGAVAYPAGLGPMG